MRPMSCKCGIQPTSTDVGAGSEGFGDRGLVVHHVAVGDGDALGVAGRAGRVLKEGDGVGGEVRHRPRVRVGERRIVGGHALERALEIESFDTRGEQAAQLLVVNARLLSASRSIPATRFMLRSIDGAAGWVPRRLRHRGSRGTPARNRCPARTTAAPGASASGRELSQAATSRASRSRSREGRHFRDEVPSGLVQKRETAVIGVRPRIATAGAKQGRSGRCQAWWILSGELCRAGLGRGMIMADLLVGTGRHPTRSRRSQQTSALMIVVRNATFDNPEFLARCEQWRS